MQQPKTMSRLTDAVKVPMIILVIFVHENLNLEADGRWGLLLATVANVAVPTFFMISGYYFFKGGALNREAYAGKLRKRCSTLLVPYMLWNLVPMINIVAGNVYSIIFRGKSTEVLQEYFTGLWNGGVWRVWWNITSGTMPYDSPLWYVRDLMVMCLVSPLIYVFICRAALPCVVLLLAIFVYGVDTGVTGLSMAAIAFFVLGGVLLSQRRTGGRPESLGLQIPLGCTDGDGGKPCAEGDAGAVGIFGRVWFVGCGVGCVRLV